MSKRRNKGRMNEREFVKRVKEKNSYWVKFIGMQTIGPNG